WRAPASVTPPRPRPAPPPSGRSRTVSATGRPRAISRGCAPRPRGSSPRPPPGPEPPRVRSSGSATSSWRGALRCPRRVRVAGSPWPARRGPAGPPPTGPNPLRRPPPPKPRTPGPRWRATRWRAGRRGITGKGLRNGAGPLGAWDDPGRAGAVPAAALLVLALLREVVGARPDAPVGRLVLAPSLPPHVRSFQVRGLPAGGGRVDLTV